MRASDSIALAAGAHPARAALHAAGKCTRRLAIGAESRSGQRRVSLCQVPIQLRTECRASAPLAGRAHLRPPPRAPSATPSAATPPTPAMHQTSRQSMTSTASNRVSTVSRRSRMLPIASLCDMTALVKNARSFSLVIPTPHMLSNCQLKEMRRQRCHRQPDHAQRSGGAQNAYR